MVGDLISQLKTKHNYQHHGTQAYKLSYLGGVACDYHRGEDVLVKESRFHGTENFHPFFLALGGWYLGRVLKLEKMYAAGR